MPFLRKDFDASHLSPGPRRHPVVAARDHQFRPRRRPGGPGPAKPERTAPRLVRGEVRRNAPVQPARAFAAGPEGTLWRPRRVLDRGRGEAAGLAEGDGRGAGTQLRLPDAEPRRTAVVRLV